MPRPLAVLLFALVVLLDVLTPDPCPPRVHGHTCRYFLGALKFGERKTPPGALSARIHAHLRPARPLMMGLAVPPQIELQLCKDRWQEHLQPGWTIRVWHRGTMQLLAELPVPVVENMIAHYLSHAGLTAAVIQIQAAPRLPRPSAPLAIPLRAVGVPLSPVQEMRRAARASRKGRAGRRRKTSL